ncbi:hypothetical protein FOZ63_030726, partial [Perkinsus olseni]
MRSPVQYDRVDDIGGQPGYFDVNFTRDSKPRRFTRLMPVSMYDIPLRGDPPQAEFVMHHPTACRATLRRGEYSWLRLRYDRIFEMRAYRSGSQYNFTEAGVLNGGIVRRFKGMVNGSMIEPEAFFFKLPTNSTQYGLMVTSGVKSYMLYRTDEVKLRDHDMLPAWLKKTRYSNVFRLPRYHGYGCHLPFRELDRLQRVLSVT